MGQYFISVYFLLVLSTVGYCQQEQVVQLFVGQDCSGDVAKNHTGSGYEIIMPDFTEFSSFKVFGLWRVHTCTMEEGCNPPLPAPILATSVEGICVVQDFAASTITMLTMFGDAAQSQKSISFFPSIELNGDVRSFGGDIPALEITYSSYFFTGVNSWTLFEGQNFNGASKCVSPDTEVIANGYGVGYVANDAGVLGSIREGCVDQATTTAGTVPTTTTQATTSAATTTVVPETTTAATTTQATTTSSVPTTTGPPIPPQSVTLYADEGCQGASVTLTSPGLPSFPTTYSSFEAFGLWRVHSCFGADCTNPPLSPPTHGHNGTCVNRALPTGNSIAVLRFGDPSQIQKSITFFSAPELDGTQRAFATDAEGVNFEYGSYFHTGTYSWTVYDGPNYSGNSICITPDMEVNDRGYGVGYLPNGSGTVGSIREGCETTTGQTTSNPTTPAPTTTVPMTTGVTTTPPVIINQTVTLFAEPGCQGAAVTLIGSGGPSFPSAYSSFEAFGLWRLYSCAGADCSSVVAPAPTYAHTPVCVDRMFPANNMIAVSRFGDPEQIRKAITLFSTPELNGTLTPITTDTANINFDYGSYFSTGLHSWTLYQGPNFDGPSTCVSPDAMVDARGYGVLYAANVIGSVGSIREGCSMTTGITVGPTTMPTTTTTNAPPPTTTAPITTTNTPTTTTMATTPTVPTTPNVDITTEEEEATTGAPTNATSTPTTITTPTTPTTSTEEVPTTEASSTNYIANVWLVSICLALFM